MAKHKNRSEWELFCDVDDFVKLNLKKMLTNNKNNNKHFRPSKLLEIVLRLLLKKLI